MTYANKFKKKDVFAQAHDDKIKEKYARACIYEKNFVILHAFLWEERTER